MKFTRAAFVSLGLGLGWTLQPATMAAPMTLTWSAQQAGSALSRANGTPLDVGSTVRLGYFDLTPAEVSKLFSEPANLEEHFTTLAKTSIGTFGAKAFVGAPELDENGISVAAAPGCFAASATLTPSLETLNAAGQRCYIWVMDRASVADSTEHGIFSNHAWLFPSAGFGGTVWDLSQVSLGDAGDIILGHRGPQISSLVSGTVLRLSNTVQLRADLADEDHDSAPGLLETAFVMDASKADSVKLPRSCEVNGKPGFEYFRKPGGVTGSDGTYTAAGLRYTVEISGDLKSWTPAAIGAAPVASVSAVSEGAEKVTLELKPAGNQQGAKFVRLRVERVE